MVISEYAGQVFASLFFRVTHAFNRDLQLPAMCSPKSAGPESAKE
jgi:hypothetical protein